MEEPLKTRAVHQSHSSSLKTKSTPNTPNKSVNFKISPVCEKEREKFLTAKYGAHQMSLIRKRLKEESKSNYVELDLDEVLDIEDDVQRRKFILNILIRSSAAGEDKNKFVEDLLEKAKTL